MKKNILQVGALSVLLLSSYGLSGKLLAAKKEGAAKDPKTAPAEPKHKRKAGKPPTAASLTDDMRKATAFIANSAKDKISVKSKAARPFWLALKTCSLALATMEEGIKAKDEKMVKGLDALGSGMTELAASWGVLRGSHPKLQTGRGVIALSQAYETFLLHFGPAAARHKKGSKPSAEETAKIAKCKAELTKLEGKIAALKGKAKPKSNELRLVVDLQHLIEELQGTDTASLKGMCKFVYQWDRLKYAVNGYSQIIEVWYPAFSKQWQTVSTEYAVLNTYFAAETWSYYEGWSYTEVAVASYGDYYERTAAIASFSETAVATSEAYAEAYAEVSATEESSEESAEINEEVEVDEEDETTAFEEVEDSADDEDGDGIDDEEDTDDDNDGTADDEDNDDDGDGVADSDDEDEDSGDDEADSGDDDSDDDGVADDDDGGGDDE